MQEENSSDKRTDQISTLALYQQLCAKNDVKPNEAILEAIKRAQVSTSGQGLSLNLSNVSIASETAGILSECLGVDSCFDEVSLADCMLSEESFRSIIGGLRTNAFCHRLDLKGNNIRGRSVELLGSYLETNESLKCLILEWNQLGMLEQSFAIFCDGLSRNSCLELLDLRNNQLNHECAVELGKVLRQNSSLGVLDLRWNNLGILGGRQLLAAMRKNHTLIGVQLAGNNISQDVSQAVEIAAAHNEEAASASASHERRAAMLSLQINSKDRQQRREVSKLIDKLDTTELTLKQQSHKSHKRIQQLQQLLEEKKYRFNQQQARLSLVESQLAVIETKYTELQKASHSQLLDKEELMRRHAMELQNLRDERLQQENAVRKELENQSLKANQLEAQIEDNEARLQQLKEQNLNLREEMAHLQADQRIRTAQAEERLQNERQKSRDELQEVESARAKELAKVQSKAESVEQNLKEQLARSRQDRTEAEAEVGRLKQQLQAEKLAAEEALASAKARWRAEEEQRLATLEERLRLVQSAKEEAQGHAAATQAQLGESQRALASKQSELEASRRRQEELQAQVASCKAEIQAEGARVKLEMQEKISAMEAERRSQKELYDDIERLKAEAAAAKEQFSTQLADRNTQIAVLNERLTAKTEELQRLREDEDSRAANLQAAVMQFCRRQRPAD